MAWRTARLSVLFLFDVARISRGEGDLLEPVIVTAILQANQAALLGDPDLQLRYDDPAWALPDEHRRPISINAIAQSLGLPFETVRRKAQALAARGVCVITSAGVYVPAAFVTSPGYLKVQLERVDRLAALHGELVIAGLQSASPALDVFLARSARAADRLLANYMLRACDGLLELTGGAMDGMVLLALCAANIRDLQAARVTDWASYGDLAIPCSGSALAQALGMSGETVRRHLHRLAQSGFCRRVRGGWVAAAPPASQPLLGKLVNDNARNLQRLFAALNELTARARGAGGRQVL